VEGTRKKTQQKLAYMQKQENQYHFKQQLKVNKVREIEEKRENVINIKQSLMKDYKLKKEQKLSEIQQEAELLKEQRRNNEETLKYIKMEELSHNRNKYEYIKSQQIFFSEKKRAYEVYYTSYN